MKRWTLWVIAVCLLLAGCAGIETLPENAPENVPERSEEVPPEIPAAATPSYSDWQAAYAALLEEKAAEVQRLSNFDRPDYDPNTVASEIDAVKGTYVLYDIDKNGVPELLFTCQNGWYTELYGYQAQGVAELGGMYSKDVAFYSWPEGNGLVYNWGRMGGQYMDRITLVDGVLQQETFFEEGMTEAVAEYTAVETVVPGSIYLYRNPATVELPSFGAQTLPIERYGQETVPQPMDPQRDEQAREAITAALNGETEFYGVTADGYGGNTGWITMEAYLAPGGATEYTSAPLEVAEQTWVDFNCDGQSEALVVLHHPEGDPYGGVMQVIFSWQGESVFAYCLNYMDSYTWTGTAFVSAYPEECTLNVAFDESACYLFAVEEGTV